MKGIENFNLKSQNADELETNKQVKIRIEEKRVFH